MIPSNPRVSGWKVWTGPELDTFGGRHGRWLWCAWGPHGFKSGAEMKADDAEFKARAAGVVLADAESWKRKAASDE